MSVFGVGASETLEAASRILGSGQPPRVVVGVTRAVASCVDEAGQQAIRRIRKLDRLAGRVGDAREVSVSVHGERGALPEGSDDGRRVSARIAFDCRDVPVAVGHGCEATVRIVGELVSDGAGECIERLRVTAIDTEQIELATIFRSDREPVRKRRQGHTDPTDRERVISDVEAAVRCHSHVCWSPYACQCGQATVAAELAKGVPRHGVDDAIRPDPADAAVVGVSDVEAAVRCYGHAEGIQ